MMKTKRLILRKFDLNDKKELISLLNDKTVTEWIELPFPYLEKHAVWWLNIGLGPCNPMAICTMPSRSDKIQNS
jgi:RimJ/RimL family protein N-acetyltransferase